MKSESNKKIVQLYLLDFSAPTLKSHLQLKTSINRNKLLVRKIVNSFFNALFTVPEGKKI